jgi:hypothetical protein
MTYADNFLHLEMFRLEHSAPFRHTCIASQGLTSNVLRLNIWETLSRLRSC